VNTLAWVQDLAQHGWRFWAEDGRLRYRAPRGAATPAVLDRLRAHKDELCRIAIDTPDDLAFAPLSYGQRALWFLWQLAPESVAYHQSLPLDVRATVDAAVWREAARILVARHPMLRTRFPLRHGEPAQQTLSSPALDWTEATVTPSELPAALVASHQRPFDLAGRPPVRFAWFRRDEQSAVLLLTMHHVASDAWSFEILRRDLAAIVETLAAGREWTTPAPAHAYTDFVNWQHSLLSSPAGTELWDFWRQQLAAPLAQLDLPADRPRPATSSYRGDSVRIDISPALSARLHELARHADVTRHVLLLSAFLAWLYRWTRQRDLVIGVPTSGRSQPEFAAIVGYFVEPVAVRVPVAEAQTFDAFVSVVKDASHAALSHADFPFALLVERLRVHRDLSRSPLFDVTFNFLSRRAAAASGAPEAGPAVLEMPQADGKFDLTLTVVDDDDRMHAALGFNCDLFDRATIERVAAAFLQLLESVAADPNQSLDAIVLGAETEPRPALQGRRLDTTNVRPVHEQVMAGAREYPDRAAVVAADGTLSYAELVGRASRLAEQLASSGVSPGDAVGLCTARSTEFIVGVLGIWQAGGAYVPLDPALPDALRGQMLTIAGARVCVMGRWEDPRPPHWDGTTIEIGVTMAPVWSTDGDADRLAYVIFTSGSTGAPKGVAVEHRALTNYVASVIGDLDLAPGASHALASTIGADLGHTVIFPSLVTGGTLHILPEEVLTDRALFAAYVGAQGIDYLKIVPSHLAVLVDDRAPVLPRRAVILGGELSSATWVRDLQRRTGCRFFNHYGPTETTVGVMTYAVPADEAPTGSYLPLDRAIANCRIWLLDGAGHSVPIGVPGEVVVSGPSLARGYIGDPVQTAERFVSAPDGARAYRTGDRARLVAESRLEILGREDRQLKLRGYRIELGQIERALLASDLVRQAVVLTDKPGAAGSFLIAYVVPQSAATVTEIALHAWLAERLPQYMRPTRLLIVDHIPVTSNGKVDENALRASTVAEAGPVNRSAVHDLVELRLCRIWSRVLGIEDVKPTDDFFLLGGHSLLAVRMASQVFEEFGQRLPLATLFSNRTIEQLARVIHAADHGDVPDGIVPIQADGEQAPLILFPGAGGSLLYFQHLLGTFDPDMPVWGAQMAGAAGQSAIAIDVATLAARYVDAIRRRWPDRDVRLAGHSFGGLVAFEVGRQLRLLGSPVSFVGILDNPAPPARDGAPTMTSQPERDWFVHIATRIERLYGVDLRLNDGTSWEGRSSNNEWLVDRLLAAAVLPADTNRAYFARWVELYRASVAAADAYRPDGPALDIPLTVFSATETDAVLDRPAIESDNQGWTRYSTLPVRVINVPGSHITMLTEPHVHTLGARLRAALDGGSPADEPEAVTSWRAE